MAQLTPVEWLIEKLKALRINAFMRSAVDIQELYCGNCDKDTKQKVYESGHEERDSSHDRFECSECGFVKYGLTGEWEKHMAQQNKEHQKKLLTEIMEADQKNGLYDNPGVEKKMTAVEWLVDKVMDMVHESSHSELSDIFQEAKRMEAEQNKVTEDTSDGFHTFKELYDFRMVYNAALFNEWALQKKYEVHKSWLHHDGELCFGGGWFIVVAILPTGQISNHYPSEYWDLLKIPETVKALHPFDGHTSQDVLNRLKNL